MFKKCFLVLCTATAIFFCGKVYAAEPKGAVDAFNTFVKVAFLEMNAEKAAAFGVDEKVQKELALEVGNVKKTFQQLTGRAAKKDPAAIKILENYKARVAKIRVVDMMVSGGNTVLTVTIDGKNKNKIVMKQLNNSWKIVSID